MPRPRRREAALAPPRGAALAPACWNSAVGTRAACPAPRPSSQMTVPLPKSAFPVAGLCHPLPGMVPATDTAGDTLGWPPRTSSSRVLAAEQAGESLPQEQGQMPKPTDTNAEALGQEEEAATQQLPALQLSACSGPEVVPGVVSSTAGMGWATLVGAKGHFGCAQPPALQWPFGSASSALWTIKIMQQPGPEKCCWAPSSALLPALGNRMWEPSDWLLWWALLRILFSLGSSDNSQEHPSIPRLVPGLIMPWRWVFLGSNWDLFPHAQFKTWSCPKRDMENRLCPSFAQLPVACLKIVSAASPQLAAL